MPFQKGHKLSPGGQIGNKGGRRSKETLFRLELERQAFIREAFRDGAAMGRHYRRQALEDNSVLKDYRAAIIGKDDQGGDEQQARPIYFVQFNAVNGAIQLPAAAVSNPVLVGNGNGHQERGEGVAPSIRQRQNGLEFHSFSHVSRKRG